MPTSHEAPETWTWDTIEDLSDDLAVIIANPGLPDCPVVFVNDAFLSHSGYDRAAALGRNCRFMQGDDTEEAAKQKFRDAVSKLKMAEIQITNYTKGGSRFVNHVLLRPLVDPKPNQTLMVAVQRKVETVHT